MLGYVWPWSDGNGNVNGSIYSSFLKLIIFQDWYLTEAIASIAPGLCLGALSKVPIEIYKFLIEVPFAKEKSPCPFKYKVSGLIFVYLASEFPIRKNFEASDKIQTKSGPHAF